MEDKRRDFTEEEMRNFCNEAVPLIEELLKLMGRCGAKAVIRIYSPEEVDPVYVTDLNGWTLEKSNGKYAMGYSKKNRFSDEIDYREQERSVL